MSDAPDDLFAKLLRNSCSEEETTKIITALADTDPNSVYDDLVLAQLTTKIKPEDFTEEMRTGLNARFAAIINNRDNSANSILTQPQRKFYHLKWFKYTAAACLIALVSIPMLVKYQSSIKQKAMAKLLHHDIAPGKDDAVLTLADGRKILLSAIANGKLAEIAGLRITKTANGQLVYQVTDDAVNNPTSALQYHTISTPRGGQYQVNLPDGTRVWLNSASSLKFPMAFAAANRQVSLTGEAYFEVAKDKKKVFTVQTDRQTVEVLGTHFDISSYPEDASTKTTLLEGSVRVNANNKSITIKPGQQAEVAETIVLNDVDAETAVAWKNGYFSFDDEELGSAMSKVARWYDVEVAYADEAFKKELIAAYTTRFANVSELLKQLNQMGRLHFQLEGRTIKITGKLR